MDEELFIKLRYCFQGGYTLPQYCLDNGIKKPLFVLEKKAELFLLEIFAQFQYDRRLTAQFCFIDGDENGNFIHSRGGILLSKLNIKNFFSMNISVFDRIILLTKEKVDIADKTIVHFADLEKFCVQQTYVNIPLLNFLQRYPQVKLFLTNFPSISRFKDGQAFSKQLWEANELAHAIRNAGDKPIETPLDKFGYTNAQVAEIILANRAKRNPDGTSSMLEGDYPLRRIENGKRATAFQPEHFQNRIYFFGPCHFYGVNASFDRTIESCLQKMLNEHNLPYRVENESQHFVGRFQDLFYNLNALTPEPGDIIFCYITGLHSNNDVIPFFDISDAFDPPNDYKEIYCRKGHVNELGYKLIAEKYFNFLTENNFFRDFNIIPPPPSQPYFYRYGIPPQFEASGVKTSYGAELEAYKQSLRAKRLSIGAIVMNCNPFTLGHQYLVEYAAAQVVRLYVFVVEEDRSEFPFADRIELVRQGVAHLPNVEVLPSGKFIISQTTFSGYFSKAELQDVAVDSSEDVEIFGREIAPTLGITIRFAGSEPTDNVTRQYNETMKTILPRYGVEFREIPRKELGDEPISASKVRAALHGGDLETIKRLVPKSSLDYLCALKPEFFLRHFTARLDVKFISNDKGDLKIISNSDTGAKVQKPPFLNKKGVGYVIQSYVGKLETVFKATAAGRIDLNLRGVSVAPSNDPSKRIPFRIDYTKLLVNDKIIFDELTSVWHSKPYNYKIEVGADDELKIQMEWLPHKIKR